ncbi:type VI secretion system tube protein Hcp [Cerasicoccus fimbriatus]|uniref:type VI secretion system tube protein Hcp n=1 Tax=Cerasicoccus fimbriatus TaxID=3014554 RepID=UPI0022B34D15|nr:type VI secretion system tube protein Hcp [Cerasicoccus sp. TK19100]
MKNHLLRFLASIALALLPSSLLGQQVNYFMSINGPAIEGGSQIVGYENQIELLSYSLGVSNNLVVNSGGISSGTSSWSALNAIIETDSKAIPDLFLLAANGAKTEEIILTGVNLTGPSGKIEFLKITLEDCYIASVDLQGADGDRGVFSVDIAYLKITIETKTVDPKTGEAGDSFSMGWNLETNEPL